jgi:hypothetical protein
VILPQPVPAGATATIEVEFEASSRGVYGYRLLAGAWYPNAIAYRGGAYNLNQQQVDEYQVIATAPASLTLASAGELVETAQAPAGQQRRHCRLPHAANFGIAASPHFLETRRASDGVDIRLYQLRGDASLDPAMADYAADAVAFYKRLLGFYPHPAVVLLPGTLRFGGGGSPASGFLQFFRNNGDGKRWIVAHEIAHQYWGFDTVIDDGDYCHWPGLALGIYTDQRYIATRSEMRFGTRQYREAVTQGLDTTIRKPLEQMRSLPFDWNEIVCHEKAYAVVRMLEDLVGAERFLQIVQTLLECYRYRYLSFDDFQAHVEAISGRQLDWFFQDWVDTNGVAGYSIEDVQPHDGSVEVRIRRTGSARFPVEVQLTVEGGAQARQRIAPEPEVQTLIFPAASKPRRVEIDPISRCPLLKTGKEVWQSSSL